MKIQIPERHAFCAVLGRGKFPGTPTFPRAECECCESKSCAKSQGCQRSDASSHCGHCDTCRSPRERNSRAGVCCRVEGWYLRSFSASFPPFLTRCAGRRRNACHHYLQEMAGLVSWGSSPVKSVSGLFSRPGATPYRSPFSQGYPLWVRSVHIARPRWEPRPPAPIARAEADRHLGPERADAQRPVPSAQCPVPRAPRP